MEGFDEELSVRKAHRRERTCYRVLCLHKVRLVVMSQPLCVRHATEEFTQILKTYMEAL